MHSYDCFSKYYKDIFLMIHLDGINIIFVYSERFKTKYKKI
jgi:hypothetical protein